MRTVGLLPFLVLLTVAPARLALAEANDWSRFPEDAALQATYRNCGLYDLNRRFSTELLRRARDCVRAEAYGYIDEFIAPYYPKDPVPSGTNWQLATFEKLPEGFEVAAERYRTGHAALERALGTCDHGFPCEGGTLELWTELQFWVRLRREQYEILDLLELLPPASSYEGIPDEGPPVGRQGCLLVGMAHAPISPFGWCDLAALEPVSALVTACQWAWTGEPGDPPLLYGIPARWADALDCKIDSGLAVLRLRVALPPDEFDVLQEQVEWSVLQFHFVVKDLERLPPPSPSGIKIPWLGGNLYDSLELGALWFDMLLRIYTDAVVPPWGG